MVLKCNLKFLELGSVCGLCECAGEESKDAYEQSATTQNGSLWEGFQDGIHFLCHSCEGKLKLVLKTKKYHIQIQ